jgi:hypothetical protein
LREEEELGCNIALNSPTAARACRAYPSWLSPVNPPAAGPGEGLIFENEKNSFEVRIAPQYDPCK